MSNLARRHLAYWAISAPRARKLKKRGVYVWFTVSESYTGWIRHNPLTLRGRDEVGGPQDQESASCGYEHGGQICRGDGLLCDEDEYYDGYDPTDSTYPCPRCNTQGYLEGAKEEAETCSSWSNGWSSGTGETIWVARSQRALVANPELAPKILAALGPVHALVADPDAPEGYVVSINNLAAAGASAPSVTLESKP